MLKKADELQFFAVLKHSLRELEASFDVALADVIDAVDSVLLREARKLATWVSLNSTAARKIVKKYDKRHGGTHGAAWFREEYGQSGLFGASSELLQVRRRPQTANAPPFSCLTNRHMTALLCCAR